MENAGLLLSVLTQLLSQAQSIGGLIARAHARGSDVTDAELAELAGIDDAARANLQALIDAKRGG